MEINEYQPIEIDRRKDIFHGRVVNSKDEAYDLYQEHAFKMGFSVRKGKELYHDNEKKKTRLKEFYCSKQGFKNNEYDGEVAYERADSRTNCKAMVRFNVDKEGVWKITKLILDHNHDLVPLEQRHLLRSMRNVSNVKGDLIKSMVNVGIRVTNSCSHSGEEVGGFNNIGITSKDMHSYVYSEKLKLIEAGDAQSLVNHLQNRQAHDAMFYYSVQLDQESRLTNVFWRDGKSKVDYDCFGDVVIFDTTRLTNKYNLICAPFVGVNHHWQNAMFGCALLFDETAVSYTWLFKAFLESMGNQQPKTIFTDQDAIMAKAIGEVMPNTCHRLCLRHIAKNAPSHLGSLNSNHKFAGLFNKCMKGCDSEDEFQSTWDEMMSEYKLHDHQWLSNMYKNRHKWSTTYGKDVFSAGIQSSQRSESTNNELSKIAGKATSLAQFLVAFEKLMEKWRQLEVEKEFKNSQSAPPRVINISETLRRASIVYTHKIFELFLNEYLDGTGGSTSVEIDQCDNVSYHEVTLNNMPNKKYTVTLDSSNAMINCSCHKFNSMGILCSHALRIYNIKGILKIPDQYFLKRWSKNARYGIYEHINRGSKENSTSNSMTTGDDGGLLYRNAIMKSFYNLVLETQEHKEAQQIMWKLLDIGIQSIRQCVGKLTLNSNVETMENNSMPNGESECAAIFNPLLEKTKKKRKQPTTEAEKINEKQNEDRFCAINSPVGEQTNVLNCMDEPSRIAYASLDAPLQQ